jgi:2-oxoglutarate ferredoxin oxidoreductase subunit beta
VQKTLAEVEAKPENTVFVSGIGCAARLPYYLATYGFHTIHGRAPAIATGIKLANPDLDVWVATGDGDALSIGGNHMLHALRRNIDLQIVLFNNEIYGLTKGQYSPTSRAGTRSPSTPLGSVERPVTPAEFAMGAGARFVARGIDTQHDRLVPILKRAHGHRGASLVLIYQNCVVYNNGAFAHFTDKKNAADWQLHVEHGSPLLFGKDGERGLRLKPGCLGLEAVEVGPNGIPMEQVLVHDETNRALAMQLASLEPPEFPVALGVLFCDPREAYDKSVHDQIAAAVADAEGQDLTALLHEGKTWVVDDEG